MIRPQRSAPSLFDILLMLSEDVVEMAPEDRFTGSPDMSKLGPILMEAVRTSGDDGRTFAVVAELLGDRELAREVVQQSPPDEAVLALVDAVRGARVVDAFEAREPWDEQRTYVIAVQVDTGEEMSAVIVADNLGSSRLADAFAGPVSGAAVRRSLKRESDLFVTKMGRAEIGTTLREAIEMADRTLPPPSTETWPWHRLIVEWMVRMMPGLPTSAADREWEPIGEEVERELIDGFLASSERRDLIFNDEDIAATVGSLLWFKDGYTNGDVHRWGPNQVGYLLEDWALRKLMVPDDELRRIPAVLRALVPWSHGQIDGLKPRHTTEVLSVIDICEPIFLEGLKPDRAKGIDALMSSITPFLDVDDNFDVSYEELEAKWRADAVGGIEVLESLSEVSLPVDEPISVDGVDAPYRSLIAHIATEAGSVARELYGPEFGTAAARLAVRLGEVDGKALARGNPETAVAGIVWMAVAANLEIWSIVQADIKEAAGVKGSPKDRARTFTKLLGAEFDQYRHLNLGSPDFLVGERRRQLVDQHRQYLDNG